MNNFLRNILLAALFWCLTILGTLAAMSLQKYQVILIVVGIVSAMIGILFVAMAISEEVTA